MKLKTTLVLISIILLFGTIHAHENKKPRLVLQITVDQLRSDLPVKFMKSMDEGSFRYLKAQHILRKTEPKDIASTLANILGTKPPSGADGEILFEIAHQMNENPNEPTK